MVIKSGDVVKIEYILKDDDGRIISSSEINNDGPVKVHLGTGQILPGFEKELIGLENGQKKEFTLTPEESYGEFDPLLVEKIPKNRLKSDINLEVGQQVEIMAPNGMSSPGWVRLIEDDFIIVDMNPPLAGRTLNFTVKVIETDLEPDTFQNPFLMGISCGESCDHNHGKKEKIGLE